MANDNRPNLFSYATSELSQDAFICWLAAWADPKYKAADPDLHKTACAFVVSMICKTQPDYNPINIKTVDVERQVEKLDILIKINERLSGKLAILVEDKTHTSNHSNQLERYYNQVREAGYLESEMIPLYFKTGYQSRFDTLGIFKTYLRSDFLSVLQEGKSNGVINAIYNDFLIHLEEMDAAIRQFSNKNINEWGDNDWRGFFMALYDDFGKLDDEVNWNYVANPAGGFFGFWWYFKGMPDGAFTPYLQLEQGSLCFKIKVDDETKRSQVREEAYQKLKGVNANLERPKRMGSGLYMTVARWKSDYRDSSDGLLNFEATLENLKKAQQILDTAFPQ